MEMRDKLADIIVKDVDWHMENGVAWRGMQAADEILAALPDMIKPLVWEFDGNRVRLDDTLMFQKGYDYDGLEMARQESYGLGSSYLIWPDSIASNTFNLYRTCDGGYIQDLSEEDAKAAANTHNRETIMKAFGQ